MKQKKIEILRKEDKMGENPFSVPQGYFETLSTRIQSRIALERKPQGKVRRLPYRFQSRIAIAASLIGLALISYTTIKLIMSQTVTEADYIDIALLEEMNVDLDESLLLDAYQLDDSDNSQEELWMDEAVEYLASNDLEIDLLYEQY